MTRCDDIKAKFCALLLIMTWSAQGSVEAPQYAYPSGFSVALKMAGELSDALDATQSCQLAPQPVALEPQDFPIIMPIVNKAEKKVLRQVSISAGLIDLVNHISHAKAIDRIQPGYFDQYVLNFVRATGDTFAVQPPSMVDPRYWTNDVLNDQLSYFNQMIGMLMAINLAHHYLGHVDKYYSKMFTASDKVSPINDFLTPDEWEVSVRAGALDALNCALATDGLRALFEAIDHMPRRPAWTEEIVPKDADLKKINKELANWEVDFFHGKFK
jgi:hypothetical protein